MKKKKNVNIQNLKIFGLFLFVFIFFFDQIFLSVFLNEILSVNWIAFWDRQCAINNAILFCFFAKII